MSAINNNDLNSGNVENTLILCDILKSFKSNDFSLETVRFLVNRAIDNTYNVTEENKEEEIIETDTENLPDNVIIFPGNNK